MKDECQKTGMMGKSSVSILNYNNTYSGKIARET